MNRILIFIIFILTINGREEQYFFMKPENNEMMLMCTGKTTLLKGEETIFEWETNKFKHSKVTSGSTGDIYHVDGMIYLAFNDNIQGKYTCQTTGNDDDKIVYYLLRQSIESARSIPLHFSININDESNTILFMNNMKCLFLKNQKQSTNCLLIHKSNGKYQIKLSAEDEEKNQLTLVKMDSFSATTYTFMDEADNRHFVKDNSIIQNYCDDGESFKFIHDKEDEICNQDGTGNCQTVGLQYSNSQFQILRGYQIHLICQNELTHRIYLISTIPEGSDSADFHVNVPNPYTNEKTIKMDPYNKIHLKCDGSLKVGGMHECSRNHYLCIEVTGADKVEISYEQVRASKLFCGQYAFTIELESKMFIGKMNTAEFIALESYSDINLRKGTNCLLSDPSNCQDKMLPLPNNQLLLTETAVNTAQLNIDSNNYVDYSWLSIGIDKNKSTDGLMSDYIMASCETDSSKCNVLVPNDNKYIIECPNNDEIKIVFKYSKGN